jgi:hypothetical protein
MTMKARLKQALRPLIAPIIRRLTAGVHARIDVLEAGWNRHVPTFLGTIASVGALGHEVLGTRRDLERQIAQLRSEIAALRRRDTGGADPGDAPSATKPRIVATEKVAAAKASGLKLDLDGGRNPRAEFVTVDCEARDGIDVIADPGNLPFDQASIREIDAGGLLDRIAQEDLRHDLLPFWLSLLAPGSKFRATARDASAMIAALAAGTCSFEEFRTKLLEQREDGFFRGNLFTPDSLSRLLSEAGFVNVTTAPLAGSGKAHALFEIYAERPSH